MFWCLPLTSELGLPGRLPGTLYEKNIDGAGQAMFYARGGARVASANIVLELSLMYIGLQTVNKMLSK